MSGVISRSVRAACVLGTILCSSARGQDFAAGAHAGPGDSPLVWIERGLPEAHGLLRVEAAATRWFGLESFETHVTAIGVAWRSVRVAAGVSRTGDAELGWNAVGLAIGGAHESFGAALRGVARRDLATEAARFGEGAGIEAGGGAWVRIAARLRAWSTAPRLWTSGLAPPLPGELELGMGFDVDTGRMWLARRAPHDGDFGAAVRVAGVEIEGAPGSAWIEARDRPLRCALGAAVRVRSLVVSISIESHPVLDETVTVGLGVIGWERDSAAPKATHRTRGSR